MRSLILTLPLAFTVACTENPTSVDQLDQDTDSGSDIVNEDTGEVAQEDTDAENIILFGDAVHYDNSLVYNFGQNMLNHAVVESNSEAVANVREFTWKITTQNPDFERWDICDALEHSFSLKLMVDDRRVDIEVDEWQLLSVNQVLCDEVPESTLGYVTAVATLPVDIDHDIEVMLYADFSYHPAQTNAGNAIRADFVDGFWESEEGTEVGVVQNLPAEGEQLYFIQY